MAGANERFATFTVAWKERRNRGNLSLPVFSQINRLNKEAAAMLGDAASRPVEPAKAPEAPSDDGP